jgi:uncharacterized protein YcnI
MPHTAKTRRIVTALLRAVVAGCAASAAILLLAVPALAHITVTPGSAPAGSAAILTFHVPNEQATADTTSVDMKIPTAHPIVNLLVKPVPGWNVSVKTITLAKPVVTDDGRFTQAVSEVIWSGGKIAPGQFQDFSVSADPLPAGVRTLAFKALQVYSNGDVVRWIDLPAPGQPAPGHPAPVLTLTPATHPARTVAVPDGPASSGSASPGASSDGTARVLAVAGLAVGLLGLAAAAVGLRRGRASGG